MMNDGNTTEGSVRLWRSVVAKNVFFFFFLFFGMDTRFYLGDLTSVGAESAPDGICEEQCSAGPSEDTLSQ